MLAFKHPTLATFVSSSFVDLANATLSEEKFTFEKLKKIAVDVLIKTAIAGGLEAGLKVLDSGDFDDELVKFLITVDVDLVHEIFR